MSKKTLGSPMRLDSALPEQAEPLTEEFKSKEKIPRPDLAEDELQEICRTLKISIHEHKLVELSYFRDGFIRQKICYPDRLDTLEKQLTIRDLYGIHWKLPIQNIVDIRLSNVNEE
ncbi:YolD-like family protein [Sporolactobacillus laevolacticus]|uniref:YolD-like family protein n=1 Tax=Sporolactobacillus laevolacticus TaxID=33018 RepID=UPI0025B36DFA|nr:YolD-like family protein [Sporolactobacillus laevolacticus]MDN3954691.1 YolD-like family protein [Sporolactobacillus laevolacticus]